MYSVQVGCPEEIKKGVDVLVSTAIFISSRFHSAVVTCTNKDNSHFLSLLDDQPEILYRYTWQYTYSETPKYELPEFWTPRYTGHLLQERNGPQLKYISPHP